MALAHRRQDRAGLDRLAVHLHHAGAAVGGVAAPCVPVRPGVSRMKWTSSWRGSISRETCSPLIVIETFMLSPPRSGACRRTAEGACRENAGEMPLVVDRPTAVGARGAVRRGDLARLPEQLVGRGLPAQKLLGPRDMDRREPDRAERNAGSAMLPPSIHTAAAAATIAQSPARRSTFSCALPPPGRSGSGPR